MIVVVDKNIQSICLLEIYNKCIVNSWVLNEGTRNILFLIKNIVKQKRKIDTGSKKKYIVVLDDIFSRTEGIYSYIVEFLQDYRDSIYKAVILTHNLDGQRRSLMRSKAKLELSAKNAKAKIKISR